MSRDLETWDGSVLDDDGNLPWERTSDCGGSSDLEDHDEVDEVDEVDDED